MTPFYTQLGLYSALIAAAVLAGGMIPQLASHWFKHQLPGLLSFSAGVMLGAACLHLLPECFELLPERAGIWILAGFLFLYTFEKFVTVHICEALDCEVHSIGMSAFVGLAIHALTEGFALGTGLLTAGIGTIVFLSIMLHKIPAALALSSILMHENYKKRNVALLQILFFLMVPLGAIIVNSISTHTDADFLGTALAFSTGTFLHISLSDLLPEVHRSGYRKIYALLAFILGLLAMGILGHGAH